MARPHAEQSSDHFDLLPFIAILMCVLGCLLLVTMSIAALSIGPGAGEGWIPAPDTKPGAKIPVLIEWDGNTATIHRDGRKVQAGWSKPSCALLSDGTNYPLKQEPGSESSELRQFLKGLEKQRASHYALFAVRPSGFANFNRFADEFRCLKIDVGYEPIKQEKSVRLLREKSQ